MIGLDDLNYLKSVVREVRATHGSAALGILERLTREYKLQLEQLRWRKQSNEPAPVGLGVLVYNSPSMDRDRLQVCAGFMVDSDAHWMPIPELPKDAP